jgi:hypothetical protein
VTPVYRRRDPPLVPTRVWPKLAVAGLNPPRGRGRRQASTVDRGHDETPRPCLVDAAADTVPAVFTRPAYLLLVVALLAGRVTCAWGLGADPCCGDDDDVHVSTTECHLTTTEIPHDEGLDHVLHAGHCHCLWQTVAAIEVVAPGEGQPAWATHHREPPTGEPRGIDRPPRPCA